MGWRDDAVAISSQLGLVQISAASMERGRPDAAGDLIFIFSHFPFIGTFEGFQGWPFSLRPCIFVPYID